MNFAKGAQKKNTDVLRVVATAAITKNSLLRVPAGGSISEHDDDEPITSRLSNPSQIRSVVASTNGTAGGPDGGPKKWRIASPLLTSNKGKKKDGVLTKDEAAELKKIPLFWGVLYCPKGEEANMEISTIPMESLGYKNGTGSGSVKLVPSCKVEVKVLRNTRAIKVGEVLTIGSRDM